MQKRYLLLPVFLFRCLPVFCQADSGIDNNLLMGYFQDQRYGDALAYLQARTDTLHGDEKAISLLGYAYFMDNRFNEAAAIYQKILATDSLSLTANNYMARISLGRKDYPAAVCYYTRLNRLKPQAAWYAKQLAAAYGNMARSDSALKYYRQSYSSNPDDPDVVVSLAALLEGKKETVLADSILDAYLATDSTQLDVISARVNAAFTQGKYRETFPFAQRLQQAADISALIAPLTFLAMAYYYTDQYDSCLHVCDFIIAHKIKTETVIYAEGMALQRLKDYPASIAAFNECVGMAISKSADTYFTEMGTDYELMKQYRKAIARYDTAHYIFHDPMRLYNTGRIYEAYLKDPKAALRYYKRYFAAAPKPKNEYEKKIDAYVKERLKELKKH